MRQVIILKGDEYWGIAHIVDLFDIDRKTFFLWQQRGLVPAPIKIGKFKFFRRDDLESKLAAGELQIEGTEA
jgi:hypothetical protein